MRAGLVIAGGRSVRMGVDKRGLLLDGIPLLERTVQAVASVCDRVIVVGSRPAWWSDDRVHFVQENPAGSGPAAAIAAGVDLLADSLIHPDEVMVLAGDLAYPWRVVDLLTSSVTVLSGRALVDIDGYTQWLASVLPFPVIRGCVGAQSSWADMSVRSLFDSVDVELVPVAEATTDIDSPAQAQAFGITVGPT
ncbi:molybdenum cofactor guanylyltransferase [Cutibacterium namnetense]|nr:nucleotidyltransferase family protein [Cutibacterium namnetense]